MEILQLTYFLDVAETQHVTHSAQRLHVAQPAITQAIRRLEVEDLPVTVIIDAQGNNLYETGRSAYLETVK